MSKETHQSEAELPQASAGVRAGRELLQATAPFAVESVARSWWLVGSTFVLLAAALIGAVLVPWWPLRLLLSILAGRLMVRAFITCHDYMHGAILVRSRLARLLFRVYAGLALTPSRSWKKSHNYHHGHVGQISTASIGAFPIMTTRMWREAASAACASRLCGFKSFLQPLSCGESSHRGGVPVGRRPDHAIAGGGLCDGGPQHLLA